MDWNDMEIISTLVTSRLCMARMRSLKVTPDQTRCELRSNVFFFCGPQKPNHFSLIWCVDSEVVAPWWVPCRVLENGKSCRKLKVRCQKVFLVAKGFNAQRNKTYESMFPWFSCFPLFAIVLCFIHVRLHLLSEMHQMKVAPSAQPLDGWT